jgi:hypothetical protein
MTIKTPAQKNGKGFDAGIPASGKHTGQKGGFPGVQPMNGDKRGAPVGSLATGAKGSGHSSSETSRASRTYTGRK